MPDDLSRRDFLRAAAVGAVGAVGMSAMGAAAQTPAVGERTLYLGTYTTAGSKGIYMGRFDTATGAIRVLGVTETVSPSFLTLTRDGRRLYAVNEVNDYLGRESGGLSAFEVDDATGGLRFINEQPSMGGSPCYVIVDRAGRHVLVANYSGGNAAVLPVRADGGVGPASQVVQHTGSGPNRARQEMPHVHSVTLDPAERFALVADLGIDRVMVYGFDSRTGALTPAPRPWAQLPPGSGPRHLAFSPDGLRVYLVCEMASTVTAFDYDAASGELHGFQTLSLLPPDYKGENTGADIHLTPDGRFLYASNRGHDSIVAFAVEPGTGRLTLIQHHPSGGQIPRNFAIDPDGRYLVVANQRSGGVVTLRLDPAAGRLSPTGQALPLADPVCVRFAP